MPSREHPVRMPLKRPAKAANLYFVRLKLRIPTYSSRDFPIMLATMLPLTFILNYVMWESRYFSSLRHFATATLVIFLFLAVAFFFYGVIAISFRERFPRDEQLFVRLGMVIPIFLLLTAVLIAVLLRTFDITGLLGYQYQDEHFFKAFAAVGIINIFLTFLQEAVWRFERHRATVRETEQLKKEYMQSQLLGLKSQLNPHFLFNSLNTLSSLIQENASEAEEFLDHMSRVYRYLLRCNDEKIVSLQTESAFLRSYYFLLKSRHGDGIHLQMEISDNLVLSGIPPLTLQMVLENALAENTASRSEPMHIHITTTNDSLLIRHNVQPKLACHPDDEAVKNISNKYRLICQREVEIICAEGERTLRLPLLSPEVAI